MQKGVCAAYARRGIAQGLLIGPVCLTAGIGLAVLTGVFSGPPLKVIEQFGKLLPLRGPLLMPYYTLSPFVSQSLSI